MTIYWRKFAIRLPQSQGAGVAGIQDVYYDNVLVGHRMGDNTFRAILADPEIQDILDEWREHVRSSEIIQKERQLYKARAALGLTTTDEVEPKT